MAKQPQVRLRAICLALPEASEEEMRRGPSFHVVGKIFALYRIADGQKALWCKVPDGAQAMLVEADPATFFVPPYFGSKGWIAMRLDAKPDWREVEAFVRRSYRLVAPKKLATLADQITPRLRVWPPPSRSRRRTASR